MPMVLRSPKFLIATLVLGATIAVLTLMSGQPGAATRVSNDPGGRVIAEAFRGGQSNVPVETSGIVEALDLEATTDSPDQRFVLRLASDVTVVVAHPREVVSLPLVIGDRVRVRGYYVWNETGGYIVGTHNDPEGPGGWILHDGKFYPTEDTWASAQRVAADIAD